LPSSSMLPPLSVSFPISWSTPCTKRLSITCCMCYSFYCADTVLQSSPQQLCNCRKS
jgi:hypothetical protein